MRYHIPRLSLFVFCLLFFMFATSHAVPVRIGFQGVLRNTDKLVTGPVGMTFRLFDMANGGTPLWEETQEVAVDKGIFSIILGDGELNAAYGTLMEAILSGDELWLEVQAADEEAPMTPRQAIVSTAFALKAGNADQLSGLTVTDLNATYINIDETNVIHSDMIVDNSIRTDDLAEQSVTGEILADRTITPDKLASFCQEGEILVQAASGWVCGTPAAPACHEGDFLQCYTGPSGTMGVAACTSGIRTCNEYGTGFGPCVGEVTPETEICDDLDNDCNGIVDDNVSGSPVWYADTDGDGAGDPAVSLGLCQEREGYVANADDCNDTSFAVNPYFGERCNGSDSNCDGQVDNHCINSMCSDEDINLSMACVSECTLDMDLCLAGCFASQASSDCQAAAIALGQCMVNSSCPIRKNPAEYDFDCIRENCASQWEPVFGSPPQECEAGETRICGSDEGACQTGIETCTADNAWSGVCEGETAPSTLEQRKFAMMWITIVMVKPMKDAHRSTANFSGVFVGIKAVRATPVTTFCLNRWG